MTTNQPTIDFESLIVEFNRLLLMIPDSHGDLKQMVSKLETEKISGTDPCDLRSFLIETASRFKNELLRHSIIPSKRTFDEPRQRIDTCCAKQNQKEIRDWPEITKP